MKLKFSFSAICRLEELEKQPASKVFASLQKGNFSFLALRSIYAAARTTDKPDITVEEAEKEIDELINKKGITEVVELLTEDVIRQIGRSRRLRGDGLSGLTIQQD